MTVNEVKSKIISGDLDNLYVFYGEEQKVQNVYIHKIAEVTESELHFIESVKDIYKYDSNSLFATRKCFVCLDDTDFTKAETKDIESLKAALGEDILIVYYSKLDKRSKLYTNFKDMCVEFEYLNPVVLEKHIRENAELSSPACKKLVDVCEQDYGRILLEIDKICNYSQSLDMPCDKALDELLESGAIYEPPGDMIFEFVAAVLAGKPKRSFRLLQDCKAIGEPSLRLLLVLFTNIKHLLQVQACMTNIEETTGLSGWEIRNVQKFQGVYRNSELVQAMHLIRQTELGIKMGKISEQIAVEYVLVNMF